MKKSERFKMLVDVAESKENQAARLLGQSRQQLETQQVRLQELQDYKQEYIQRFHLDGKRGISAARLQAFQVFIAQLDQAIDEQKQRVDQAETRCEHSTHHWKQQHIRTQALDKTHKKHVSHENHLQDKKLQRESDDRSGVIHRRVNEEVNS